MVIDREHEILQSISEKVGRGATIIDSIVAFSEENGLEIEVVGQVIRKSDTLKALVRREAESLNLVEKETSGLKIFVD